MSWEQESKKNPMGALIIELLFGWLFQGKTIFDED
jgi:hypothetical protein